MSYTNTSSLMRSASTSTKMSVESGDTPLIMLYGGSEGRTKRSALLVSIYFAFDTSDKEKYSF